MRKYVSPREIAFFIVLNSYAKMVLALGVASRQLQVEVAAKVQIVQMAHEDKVVQAVQVVSVDKVVRAIKSHLLYLPHT